MFLTTVVVAFYACVMLYIARSTYLNNPHIGLFQSLLVGLFWWVCVMYFMLDSGGFMPARWSQHYTRQR